MLDEGGLFLVLDEGGLFLVLDEGGLFLVLVEGDLFLVLVEEGLFPVLVEAGEFEAGEFLAWVEIRSGSFVGQSVPVSSVGRGRGLSSGHSVGQSSGSSLAIPLSGSWAKTSPTSLQYNRLVTPGPTLPMDNSCSALELFERFFYTGSLGSTCSRNKQIC